MRSERANVLRSMTASFRMQEKTSCYAFTQSMPVSDAVRAVSQEQ
jgi:hypothetical protein